MAAPTDNGHREPTDPLLTPAETRRFLEVHLADDAAHAARESFCRTVVAAMKLGGRELDLVSCTFGDDNARALAQVAAIAGALGSGAVDLLDARNAYAAAALIRQVVEVEYLLWTFADDIEDAGRWLRASRNELGKRFTPSAMRKRSVGKFRSQEYRRHCERGGHPHPAGGFLLDPIHPVAVPPLDAARVMWADLGHHLERGWHLFVEGVEATGFEAYVEASKPSVEEQRCIWHVRDALAKRLPVTSEAP